MIVDPILKDVILEAHKNPYKPINITLITGGFIISGTIAVRINDDSGGPVFSYFGHEVDKTGTVDIDTFVTLRDVTIFSNTPAKAMNCAVWRVRLDSIQGFTLPSEAPFK